MIIAATDLQGAPDAPWHTEAEAHVEFEAAELDAALFDEAGDATDVTRVGADGGVQPATSLSDLSALSEALDSSDRIASAISSTLNSMAQLADALSPSQLQEMRDDPLMVKIVDLMDANMHRFTADPLAKSLWAFGKMAYVPGRCARFHISDRERCVSLPVATSAYVCFWWRAVCAQEWMPTVNTSWLPSVVCCAVSSNISKNL